MSKAQIIVIAVGVPVVAAIIVIACALHFRRRRHMKKECPVEAPPESTRHDKDIILSPKQILGLDDDTYLSHLPSKLSDNSRPITVRPARLEIDSKSSRRGYEQTKRHQEQGVSPWDVEYKPNPVIFAHLAARTPSPPPQRLYYNEVANLTQTNESETALPALSLVDTSSSSADNAISSSSLSHSGSSQTSDDEQSIGVVTRKPEGHVDEQVSQTPQCMSGGGEGTSNLHSMLYGDRHDFLQVLTAMPDPQGEHTIHEMPPAPIPALTPSYSPSTLNSTPDSIEDEASLPHACPNCPRTFRTPGLLRNHYNRAHNLRYTCNLCNGVSFGLAADLKRHKRNVHQQFLGSDETYQCTIPGCATPNKIFRRKDNFNRHVKRCRKQIGKGKAEERAEPEVKEE